MTQPDFQEFAQQEDADEIAALIAKNLRKKGIKAKATAKEECLRVIVEADQTPGKQAVVDWVHKKLASLKSDSIKTLKVYGWQTDISAVTWKETIELDNQDSFFLIESSENPASSLIKAPEQTDPDLMEPSERPAPGSEFLATLKTFKFASVFPYKQALSPDLYNSYGVRLLLLFSLFPWVFLWLGPGAGQAEVSWILGIYYALIWGLVLHQLIKPVQFSWRHTLYCSVFTVIVGIFLLQLFQGIPLIRVLYIASDASLILNLLFRVLWVGVLEEVCKGLSVYLFLLRPGQLSDPLTAAFYGAISGLGFAIVEGPVYFDRSALGVSTGELDLGGFFLVNTLRLVSLPLFHAIWSGIVGYFIGLAAINPSRERSIIFIGVAIAAILHGLYDTFVSNLLGLAILIFSILLFVAYLRRSRQLVNEMKQAETIQGNLRLTK
ncbi:MAG: PrsW family glutamic-type intramembrane protease [Leptolyngbyaceae cyanobacterium MO_188.B28]|nr:PrsW family glutamic-type intramembrane protease [Leptolyngbyaceae cyanobacterium MO_188.B28]